MHRKALEDASFFQQLNIKFVLGGGWVNCIFIKLRKHKKMQHENNLEEKKKLLFSQNGKYDKKYLNN